MMLYIANQSQKSNPGYAQYCQALGPSLDQPGQPCLQMAKSSQGQPSHQPDQTQP